MLLFRKHSDSTKQPEENNATDKAAGVIATAIVKRQKQLASFCSSRYEKLSLSGRKMLMLLFCFLFGGACLWLLVKGLWPEHKQSLLNHMQNNYPGSLPLTEPDFRDSLNLQHFYPLQK
ncbi:hypothetical protein [Botryobacter ruber]|uniref:hypothetical protein n=1 Tax=Botryobacter ruber TaxID=2171629 RepID=UPI000E0A08A1|nr:hypothetical protein [Botryobacter ruber]